MAVEFFIHWNVIGAVPVAAAENVAVCPAAIVALDGCVVIVGGRLVTTGMNTTSRK
jgi:hypothetical protein